jgi:hypothetical protein
MIQKVKDNEIYINLFIKIKIYQTSDFIFLPVKLGAKKVWSWTGWLTPIIQLLVMQS